MVKERDFKIQNGFHSYGAEECAKSELDTFPIQASIENSFYVEVPPLATLIVNSSLEFFILGPGDRYLDLSNTLLYMCCKYCKRRWVRH